MENKIIKISDQLKQLALQNNIENVELKREPLGGRYLGFVILEGIKKGFLVTSGKCRFRWLILKKWNYY